MVVGTVLLSRMTDLSSTGYIAFAMAVFGLGLGLVMQVLIVAVQNNVNYEALGTATSGVTFFRSTASCSIASLRETTTLPRLRFSLMILTGMS